MLELLLHLSRPHLGRSPLRVAANALVGVLAGRLDKLPMALRRAEEVEPAVVFVVPGGLVEIESLAANKIRHPHIASLSGFRSATTFWYRPPK